ncbi:unnamed protein product [Orchesella dallaii]|uniref:Uncharacterized protein n=1 Tax=Orchesella dallaii TaxID=48710 RepID=A0ABP1R7W8_9HEXA
MSTFMSVVYTLFVDFDFSEWSLRHWIIFRSCDFRIELCIWSKENFANLTDELIDTFGSELTPATLSLGVFRLFMDFCETFQDFCFIDIWLFTALETWRLAAEVNLPKTNTFESDFEGIWSHYKHLQKMSDTLENVLGNFFKQIHISNLFLSTYFLLKCMAGDYGIVFWLRGINIIKICLAYYAAAAAADMSNKVERWFLENFFDKQTVKVGGRNGNTSFILHELSNYRFGIGRRNFFIDQTFNMKFLGVVGSYFLIIADSKAKQKTEE